MFKKSKITRDIKRCQLEIKDIEQKRTRSQAALVQSILAHQNPDKDDVKYFKQYTEEIETIRIRLHALQDELKKI